MPEGINIHRIAKFSFKKKKGSKKSYEHRTYESEDDVSYLNYISKFDKKKVPGTNGLRRQQIRHSIYNKL